MQIAIIGLPNVGKSTLFNALLRKMSAQSANFPFCTIEPNIGIVAVPDERLDALNKIIEPERTTSAQVEFIDVAGLVRGASTGEGLGNKFLSHIRSATAILQVIRVFDDKDIIHVDGNINAKRDLDTVNTELILADLQTITNRQTKIQKNLRTNDKNALLEAQLLERIFKLLNDNQMANEIIKQLTPDELILFNTLNLLTAKTMMLAVNIAEDKLNNFDETSMKNILHSKLPIVPICAKLEADMAEFNDTERQEYLNSLGIIETGLQKMIKLAYHTLGLITYFTAGIKEVRAWTIPLNATAPQAAGVIHTDFETGFIKAETVHFPDFIKAQGWAGARTAGLAQHEGRDYIVQDGDIMLFKFNN